MTSFDSIKDGKIYASPITGAPVFMKIRLRGKQRDRRVPFPER